MAENLARNGTCQYKALDGKLCFCTPCVLTIIYSRILYVSQYDSVKPANVTAIRGSVKHI